ncbi:S8 family serine peptidase [Streptomyces dysideae]|uniref:Serine protease n=1 Tax=Streptomyces dysideae TaxID=909626 RepID=A0A117RX53_9ACTN|nr:S8 family serine peptidase [Streptomyces dysideae]KUO14421.1 serine protease [Streptomyces dysideae]
MAGRTPSGRTLAARAGAAVAALVLAVTMPTMAVTADSGALRESEWALTALKAEQAWEVTRGEGVTVAVIGTGVDASHPDLTGRVVKSKDVDGTRDEGDAAIQGTHAAGIIAGTGRNYDGDGLFGLAPEARILPFSVYRDNTALTAATARSIMDAARQGAKVINVTVGFTRPLDALKTAVEFAAARDALIVAGAGDTGGTGNAETYPAAYPGVLSVTAVDKKGTLWPDSHHGEHVDLAAPGVDILTTAKNRDYWTGQGTGFAASWVAASAALLRSEHPKWTVSDVTRHLTQTAIQQGKADWDARYGWGVVAPAAALQERTVDSARADRTSDAQDRTNGESSDAGPILIVLAVAMVLLVLVVTAWLLIRRGVSPTDEE